MTEIKKIREQLKESGIDPGPQQKIEALGLEVTVCQLVTIIMSMFSVSFLVLPIFLLQSIFFIIVFMLIGFVCMGIGIFFWIKKSEICEHPEDYV